MSILSVTDWNTLQKGFSQSTHPDLQELDRQQRRAKCKQEWDRLKALPKAEQQPQLKAIINKYAMPLLSPPIVKSKPKTKTTTAKRKRKLTDLDDSSTNDSTRDSSYEAPAKVAKIKCERTRSRVKPTNGVDEKTSSSVENEPVRQFLRPGRRHLRMADVRLRPNSSRSSHPATRHCETVRQFTDTLAARLGACNVIVIECSNKSRVPLGLIAADKQHPICFGFTTETSTDRGPEHELIPSAYAFRTQTYRTGGGDVTCSGGTQIFIRSGYHATVSALNRFLDLDSILSDARFKQYHSHDGSLKSVLVIGVDNDPDESSTSIATQQSLRWLQLKYNFDAVYYRNSAPLNQAFGSVERRMALLSRLVVGKIVPHNYAAHLSEVIARGAVTSEEMCLSNFNFAGKLLAQAWDGHGIDGHIVRASYVPPLTDAQYSEKRQSFEVPEHELYSFYAKHGELSQYFIQLRNCLNADCTYCGRDHFKSNIAVAFPPIFLPAPTVVKWTGQIPQLLKREDRNIRKYDVLDLNVQITLPLLNRLHIPFDYYNPEFSGRDWQPLKCPFCDGVYFPTNMAMMRHRRALHQGKRAPADGASKDTDAMLKQKIKQIEINEIESVKQVMVGHRGRYLCVMSDNTRCWIALSDRNCKVQQYNRYCLQQKLSTKHGLLVVTADNREKFFQSPFLFETEEIDYNHDNTERHNTNIQIIPLKIALPPLIPM